MNCQEKSIRKLEFSTILEELNEFAILPAVKNSILHLESSSDVVALQKELAKVKETLGIIGRLTRAPMYISSDYEKLLDLLKKGAILSAAEIYETVRLYDTMKANLKFGITLKKEQIPSDYYQSIISQFCMNEELAKILSKAVDEEGNVLDEASALLKSIRKRIVQIENNLKQKLQDIIAKEVSKLSQTNIVLRDDRYCLAVKSEYKNQIPGIIHDTSASMQTFFIEPLIVSQMVSDKMKLQEEEKIEVYRILKELSKRLSYEESYLRNNFDLLKEIDFIFAKGMFAKSYDGYMPKLNHKGKLNLINARHPLLKVKKVIPNNISFGENYLGIIVTGPNTGGKTVLLKTVGLLCTMIKYGLLIPADENSEVMIFDQVFCDIGDDQSIVNNLSTFSSHMTNIIEILNKSDEDTFVLLDEICAGTDPQEGAVLAKTILEHLAAKGVYSTITTHYGELKALEYQNPYFKNASVEFDTNSLKPTYRLLMGIPGLSNAILIASNLGLDKSIVAEAKNLLISQKDPSILVVEKLQETQHKLAQNLQEAENLKEQSLTTQKEYEQNLSEIKKDKKKTIKRIKDKFDYELLSVKAEIKDILDELRREKSEKIARRSYARLAGMEQKFRSKLGEHEEKTEYEEVQWDNVQINDKLLLKELNQVVTLLGLPDKNGKVPVLMGNIKTQIKKDKLAAFDKQYEKKQNTYKPSSLESFTLKKYSVSNTLDIRGYRVEDALDTLEGWLDEASLANISPVTVIHGHGTGALKSAVRDFLSTSPYVASFRVGNNTEGGDGVSIIDLK